MKTNEPTKLWSFEFTFLLVISCINFGAFGITMPIFPGFAVSPGAGLGAAGLVTGLFSFIALVGRPFTGLLGDRFNKKKLLIISLVLCGLSTIMYAFTPSIISMVPARIIHGLVFSVCGTISMALLRI